MCIKLDSVSKSFGEKVVLRDFSLELPESGAVALMGPSGCGKTTLIRLLAGLEKPDGGTVAVQYNRLSIVFQEDRLLGGVSALGNVYAVLGRGKKQLALDWLERMGLKNDSRLLPGNMSGGMRRRLAIARAMAYGGDLLLLDEPFAGLDEATRKRIYPHIFCDGNAPRLSVLVTHDRQEAECYAQRLIVFEGPPLTVVEVV